MSEHRRHHRPAPREAAFFDEYVGAADPALLAEAAERAAALLVRGAHTSDDAGVAERLVHLADTEGIEAIAEVWSQAPADTLAGCLWRLYLLRSWVYADPAGVARQFEAGRSRAEFARVVAGVADPPGPDELRAIVDEVLRGIAEGEFADVLLRASAFARVVAAGRATLHEVPATDIRRMLELAEQLEAAGHLELLHRLA
ncbi:hypothetical protein [Nocardioides daeguensis]|uniref:DNA-directed RNA polymerase subunit beta n=1 Tax=Nocardioides daeguensis TaxID=908359 RepID=A0ABP6VB93_9ACTN|nr:hypothetical protein [Nocardioides daeguensis]MBV6729396.1 hypothetical protein [Nocardioides daeguensis]MCR1771831.1 hypothetical protein [Nocardioides daeguensis]